MKEMLKERIAEIEILEGHPDDEQLGGYITFGLFVKVGEGNNHNRGHNRRSRRSKIICQETKGCRF